jgi:hypothetical protein
VRCKVGLDVGVPNPGDTAPLAVPMSDFDARGVQQKWVDRVEAEGVGDIVIQNVVEVAVQGEAVDDGVEE